MLTLRRFLHQQNLGTTTMMISKTLAMAMHLSRRIKPIQKSLYIPKQTGFVCFLPGGLMSALFTCISEMSWRGMRRWCKMYFEHLHKALSLGSTLMLRPVSGMQSQLFEWMTGISLFCLSLLRSLEAVLKVGLSGQVQMCLGLLSQRRSTHLVRTGTQSLQGSLCK